VVDFIDIGVAGWRFWIFNVADVAIFIGAVLLLAASFSQHRGALDTEHHLGGLARCDRRHLILPGARSLGQGPAAHASALILTELSCATFSYFCSLPLPGP
jgi:hypothetical protein